MTQPATLDQSFDTSLVDVQKSFSSTETNTSGSSGKENNSSTGPGQARVPSPWKTVSTDVLYDQWASTYDTDGNVLQAMDDIMLDDLLPRFVRLTNEESQPPKQQNGALRILDLGCGTGRNTAKLLQSRWRKETDITGWDSSPAMLELARPKCEAVLESRGNDVGVELQQLDISNAANVPDQFSNHFNGLISTLVLEHIAIETFFNIITRVLQPGCHALITNMHPDMGALSRAGYKTASGERFKATSYIYTVADTIEAARKAGLEIVDDARETAVSEEIFDGGVVNGVAVQKGLVDERARKWIGTKIWFGMILRKK